MIHKRLLKIRWYKQWHKNPAANIVHSVILLLAVAINAYLLQELVYLIRVVY
jgi:hypothetical protein